MEIDLKFFARVIAVPCRQNVSVLDHDIRKETLRNEETGAWVTAYAVYEGVTTNYAVRNGKKPIAAFTLLKEAKEFVRSKGKYYKLTYQKTEEEGCEMFSSYGELSERLSELTDLAKITGITKYHIEVVLK